MPDVATAAGRSLARTGFQGSCSRLVILEERPVSPLERLSAIVSERIMRLPSSGTPTRSADRSGIAAS
ncbi:MAG TPA: hypothetical protein VII03_01120, partial [Solirubrobacteraceae bacterium]